MIYDLSVLYGHEKFTLLVHLRGARAVVNREVQRESAKKTVVLESLRENILRRISGGTIEVSQREWARLCLTVEAEYRAVLFEGMELTERADGGCTIIVPGGGINVDTDPVVRVAKRGKVSTGGRLKNQGW